MRKEAEVQKEEAEQQLGLDAARILSAKFENVAELKVGNLVGQMLGEAEFDGALFNPTQRTTAPFSVDYYIDLREITPRSYHWSGETDTLTIDVPDVKAGKPNIDASMAVTTQTGAYISRQAGLALNKTAYRNIRNKASSEANKPERLEKARSQARSAIMTLSRQALQGAGQSQARVAVSFPWEPKLDTSLSERWDLTRSPREVLSDRTMKVPAAA